MGAFSVTCALVCLIDAVDGLGPWFGLGPWSSLGPRSGQDPGPDWDQDWDHGLDWDHGALIALNENIHVTGVERKSRGYQPS